MAGRPDRLHFAFVMPCKAFGSADGDSMLQLAQTVLRPAGLFLTPRVLCDETPILSRNLQEARGCVKGGLHVLYRGNRPRSDGVKVPSAMHEWVWVTSFDLAPGAAFAAQRVDFHSAPQQHFALAPDTPISINIKKDKPSLAKLQRLPAARQTVKEIAAARRARAKLWAGQLASFRATAILRGTANCAALLGASLEHCQAVAGDPALYRRAHAPPPPCPSIPHPAQAFPNATSSLTRLSSFLFVCLCLCQGRGGGRQP